MNFRTIAGVFITLALILIGGIYLSYGKIAVASGMEDPTRAEYLRTFKGKRVAFLPMTLGADVALAWGSQLKRQADELGYELIIRDPNRSTEVGSQALVQLIADKPDVIVLQSPDVQSYARLLKRAEAAGIYTIQINMKSTYVTDGFVGIDYYGLGAKAAELVVRQCGKGSGRSGKVSIVQGVLTGGASVYQIRGITDILSRHPEIMIVSNQPGDWDASKANALTRTALQQHPDLCAVIGFWDGMDRGIGAAVRMAGKTGEVFVVTSGGGEESACDSIENGTFSAYLSMDAMGQGRDLNNMIKMLLQSGAKPGTMKIMNYSPMTVLDRNNVKPGSCWALPKFP